MTTPGNNTSDHQAVDHPDSRDALIARRARTLYREASQQLDPATAGRLRAARRQALDSINAKPRRAARWLIPTGAFAAVAFALVLVWQPMSHAPTITDSHTVSATDQSADVDNDLPPDADKTDPNLYQNLDFYGWLAANNASNNQPVNR